VKHPAAEGNAGVGLLRAGQADTFWGIRQEAVKVLAKLNSNDVRTGWVVQPGDSIEIARALATALALDATEYRALAARARAALPADAGRFRDSDGSRNAVPTPGCPMRSSGKRPHEARTGVHIPGEMSLTRTNATTGKQAIITRRR